MSGGSFCIVDRFLQQWYYGFIDIIVQINPGLSGWTQRATPDSDCMTQPSVELLRNRYSQPTVRVHFFEKEIGCS